MARRGAAVGLCIAGSDNCKRAGSQRIIFGASVFEQVSEATVTIVERPWERVVVDGKPHSHGEKSLPALLLFNYLCRDSE